MQISYDLQPMPPSSPARTRSNWPLEQLPGLAEPDCCLLQQFGITTTGQLLAAARTHRQQLVTQLQLHLQRLTKWVALAELSQVPGVGTQYCGLLLHAGVSSCAQLALMPASRLHQNLLRLHVTLLQDRSLCPSVGEVTQWIQQARQLTR